MRTILLEIRDRGTFLPMFAMSTRATNSGQEYLLRRAGYDTSGGLVILGYLRGGEKCEHDPYNWNDRTKQTVHAYIEKNFHNLNDGDVVDVEFILGETSEPKISERISVYD